jgi:hypothetical protein
MPLYTGVRDGLTLQAQTKFEEWFMIYSQPDEILGQVMTKANASTFFEVCFKGNVNGQVQ